jgi:hypothetical protein
LGSQREEKQITSKSIKSIRMEVSSRKKELKEEKVKK